MSLFLFPWGGVGVSSRDFPGGQGRGIQGRVITVGKEGKRPRIPDFLPSSLEVRQQEGLRGPAQPQAGSSMVGPLAPQGLPGGLVLQGQGTEGHRCGLQHSISPPRTPPTLSCCYPWSAHTCLYISAL